MRRAVVHLLLLVVSGLLATGAHAADVRLSASSSSAWVGLPVTVTLQIVNAARHDAPLLPEVANAEVEFRGQVNNSTQVSIINGRRSQVQTVAYAWDVTPRAPGPACRTWATGWWWRWWPMPPRSTWVSRWS